MIETRALRTVFRVFVALATAVCGFQLLAAPGHAQSADSRLVDISVHSPSMGRDIPLQVLRPADTSTPAPTLYLSTE